jgi:hypothetical protein
MSQENFNNDTDSSADAATQETLDALNSSSEMAFVTGEQKKPINKTSLVLFLIVALGGGGLWLMHAKLGPKSASASDAAKADKTIGQFLNGGSSNIKLMEDMLRNTEKVVQQFNNDQGIKQIPLGELQTNPFRVTTNDDKEDPVAKRKLAEQRLAVLKEYQALQLQSIMCGKVSTCMINNTLYKEGQQVNGFVIDKITKDTVSVKQGAWRFDLKMQK